MAALLAEHAVSTLEEDHREIQNLFLQFDAPLLTNRERRIANDVLTKLEIHSNLEENVTILPSARRLVTTT
jgi:hypothetical protein